MMLNQRSAQAGSKLLDCHLEAATSSASGLSRLSICMEFERTVSEPGSATETAIRIGLELRHISEQFAATQREHHTQATTQPEEAFASSLIGRILRQMNRSLASWIAQLLSRTALGAPI